MSEVDAMVCRACGQEERASEGYPCDNCGDFICLICSFEGITMCKACAERALSVAGKRDAAGGSAAEGATLADPESAPESPPPPPDANAVTEADEPSGEQPGT